MTRGLFNMIRCFALAAVLLASGCATTNPSFDVSRSASRAALKQMRDNPQAQSRPVLVLGGYLDPGLLTYSLASDLQEIDPKGTVIAVSFSMTSDFESCRARVLRTIEDEQPHLLGSGESDLTEAFDVVAISMGGLVARYMAKPREDGGKRLQIKRLFTISSPHQGATWAYFPSLNRKQTLMRPGSVFLETLNEPEAPQPYEMYCYVRLRDSVVGPQRAAPPGQTAWWVHTPFWQSAHLGAPADPRIIADICRRLRNETPFTTTPAAPLP